MKLKEINYSVVLLCLLVGKVLITGASIGDAVAISALSALYGFIYYTEANKAVVVNEDIKQDIEQLKSNVNALKIAKTMQRL